MSHQHEPTPGAPDATGWGPAGVLDDAAIEHAVAELEAVPADELACRLDAGERLHQKLTDRLRQTGRDGD